MFGCSMRSTMTALTEVQKIWANNSEMKEKTGILMWDLSAACVQFENPCPLPQSAWEGFGIYGRWKMDKQILLRRVKATIRLSLRRASHRSSGIRTHNLLIFDREANALPSELPCFGLFIILF